MAERHQVMFEEPMAVVLPGKFIFLATPYTGSMSVSRALKQIPGAFAAYNKPEGIGHHARLEQVREVCGEVLTGTEKILVGIRNPYDLLVSWYLRNQSHFQVRHLAKDLGREPSFLEFLRVWVEADTFPYMNQGRIFYHAEDGGHRFQRLFLRQENLKPSLEAALRSIPGVPKVSLGRENATPGKAHWTTYYDAATYSFVNETFRRDFVKFGYAFQ